LHVFLTQRK